MSFFLWIGTMFGFFQHSGKTLELMQFWNIIEKDLTRESSHNLTILTDISSKPWALLMSRLLIILSMSLSSRVMEESLTSVLKTTESGIWELLSMGVLWEANNLLKWLAFSSKSETSLSLTIIVLMVSCSHYKTFWGFSRKFLGMIDWGSFNLLAGL